MDYSLAGNNVLKDTGTLDFIFDFMIYNVRIDGRSFRLS